MISALKALNDMFAKRNTVAHRAQVAKHGKKASKLKTVYCVDDQLSLSVQASREHFCTPKTDEGPYTHVEVGFPSIKPPETWRAYCKGDFDSKPLDSVYAYVPLEWVASWIAEHGGIREEVPKMILPKAEKVKTEALPMPSPSLKDLGISH